MGIVKGFKLRLLSGCLKVNGQGSAVHCDLDRREVDIVDGGSREELAARAFRAGVICGERAALRPIPVYYDLPWAADEERVSPHPTLFDRLP